MESHLSESVVIRLTSDKPVRKTPYQVKGVFMNQFSDQKIDPFLNGKLRNKYLYPRVQVKILNEQIYIIGIKEGINPVLSLIDNIRSLNDIYVAKKQNIDLMTGSPKYIYSNIQYSRCIRNDR